jgi:cell wall-associated NlpC family hydrolase
MVLDRRLNAFRPDLADIALKGQVDAEAFVEGETFTVADPVVALRPGPDMSTGIDTELLYGEKLAVFERKNGWAWVKAAFDGYVGYLPETSLSPIARPTHWIIQPRTFLYPGPDMKLPRGQALSMGSRVEVTGTAETRGTRYFLLANGSALIAAHCGLIDVAPDDDYVSIAARLLETPYLWGGKSAFGIDCSGLVQLSLMTAGRSAPRDSDMQASGLGFEIGRNDLRRGDLVFWKGHAAIMEDEATLIHANGHTMSVAREPFEKAISRIGYLYGEPTSYRRP